MVTRNCIHSTWHRSALAAASWSEACHATHASHGKLVLRVRRAGRRRCRAASKPPSSQAFALAASARCHGPSQRIRGGVPGTGCGVAETPGFSGADRGGVHQRWLRDLA
eukprot:2298387-Prymnesium_polylepis.1